MCGHDWLNLLLIDISNNPYPINESHWNVSEFAVNMGFVVIDLLHVKIDWLNFVIDFRVRLLMKICQKQLDQML